MNHQSAPTTFRASPAGVRAALDALGGTPAAVADTLLAGGYGGHAGSAFRCPVANYLCAVIPAEELDDDIEVNDTGVWVDAKWSGLLGIRPPAPVAAFIDAFDSGEFPELNTNNAPCDCDVCTA